MALLRRAVGRPRRTARLLALLLSALCLLYLGSSYLTRTFKSIKKSSAAIDDRHPGSRPEPVVERLATTTSATTTTTISSKGLERANGVLVMLATENELTMARETVRRFEDRFNRHRRYPWVFLTHTKFSAQFKELTSALTGGDTFYGQIPRENWSQPSWVDYHSMVSRQQDLLERGINDAMNMTKRHMWRFHSGLLARHELMASYDFFWRVEPGIHLYCDMEIDPMLEMQRTGKKFAWSLSLRENQLSTPSVWKVLQNFKATYPTLIPAVNDEEFIRDKDKDDYNDCSYGVQNSIGSFEFFRSEAYRAFFDFVDRQGVIYYERWTDAIVMTLGLSLLLPRSEILFLDELAWAHGPFHHCPVDEAFNQQRCICNPASNVDDSVLSCTAMWHGREQKKSKKETVVCQKSGKCILYVDISGR